jgi:hypothetical protein
MEKVYNTTNAKEIKGDIEELISPIRKLMKPEKIG